MKKLRFIIADDHAMIRQGVRSVIETQPGWEVCAEAADGRTAVELVRTIAPDVAILDITMPGLNGVDVTRMLKAESPSTRVLVLTMHESDALADEVMQAGGDGYLLKSDASEKLTEAVDKIMGGRFFLSSQFPSPSAEPGEDTTANSVSCMRLTPREREIVQLIAEGKSNKQVADTLGISPGTAETHRKNILSKLNLHSTADLVRYAIRNKLTQA